MNKILLTMTAVSAVVFSSAASAIVLSVGFDDGVYDGAWDTIVNDGDIDDLDLDMFHVAAQTNGFDEINIGTVDSNPFDLHMTASMSSIGTKTFGATAVDLSLSNLGTAIFTMGGSGFTTSTTSAYLDTANGAFGTGILIGTVTGGSPLSFISAQYGIEDEDFFSLTLITTMTNASGGASVDADIKVPEPSMIALISLGLVGLGIAGRRKKAK